ncbi:MAG: T9SS type A sorting domain-containing protein [Flavobacteriales bacterium]|nr:T9SS type A sorting domain-containing protein [Flavobacteriales bacterium]
MSRSVLTLAICLLFGRLIAQQTWDWGFGQHGFALDIATDADGYSYLVGNAYDSTGFMGFATIGHWGYLAKIAPTGSVQWCRAFTNVTFAQVELKDNVVFAAGHGFSTVVVGSQTFNMDSTSKSYLAAAFDTSGTELWVNCAEVSHTLSTGDIDANGSGELFVAASGSGTLSTATDTFSLSQGATSILVLKYSATGDLEWVNSVGCGPGSKARAYGVACDASGNAYVTGFASLASADCDSLLFGSLGMPPTSRFFLAQVDGSGTFQWLRHGFNATGNDVEYLDNDSLIVTGVFPDSTNAVGIGVLHSDRIDMFIGSFGSNGGSGWAYMSEVANDSSYCEGIKLERTDDGTFLVLSGSVNTVLFDAIPLHANGHGLQVSKFLSNGERMWSATMEIHPAVTNTSGITPYGLSSDEAGRGYACGYFVSPNGPNYFLSWDTDSIQGPVTGYSNFIARTALDPSGISERILGQWRVFPNPSTGVFYLEGPTPEEITLLDLSGREIERRVDSAEIDLSQFPSGVYVLHVVKAHIKCYISLVLVR